MPRCQRCVCLRLHRVQSCFRKQDIHFCLSPVVSYEEVRAHCAPLQSCQVGTIVLAGKALRSIYGAHCLHAVHYAVQ